MKYHFSRGGSNRFGKKKCPILNLTTIRVKALLKIGNANQEKSISFALKRLSNFGENKTQYSQHSVVFRESVRKNAQDCFEKKGFARNRHFQGTANFGYLEAIKCRFEARNRKCGQILTRIQSYFIFYPLHLAVKGPCRKSSLSRNSKFRVLRGN